jgi:hypothetical protein
MVRNVRLLKEKIAHNLHLRMISIARACSMDMMSNVKLLKEKIA